MLKISEEDKAFLREHIEDADTLMGLDTRRELLIAMQERMNLEFDKDWFPNELGQKLQEVYDRIYADNQKTICFWR